MKAHIKFFLWLVIPLLFAVNVTAEGECGYIVRLNDPAERPVFITVADAVTAQALVDSGDALYFEENLPVTLPEYANADFPALFSASEPAPSLDMTAFDFLGADGTGVTVAVIDSGVAYDIDGLAGVVVGGVNCIDTDADYTDDLGHGTAVTSVIAGADVGNAPGAKVYMYKCFDSKTSTQILLISNTILDAAENDACRIINLSFGLKSSTAFTDSINYAVSMGKIVVASAGNSGSATLYYPASYENVISVGSVSADGIVSSTSQKNESIDITAPGENIDVYAADGTLTVKSGTSFSAPAVCALIARILEYDPSLDRAAVYSLITSSATPAGDPGRDNSYGFGIADPMGAARALVSKSVLLGDVDGDGSVTPADEIYLARALAGKDGYTLEYNTRSDTYIDGEITALDHAVLARQIAGHTAYTLP